MKTFSTDDLDLASLLIVETGQQPQVIVHPSRSLFSFEQTEKVDQVTLAYVAGTVICNARELLRARRGLFNQIRGGRRGR